MEAWSTWLLSSLVERSASSGICSMGELAVLANAETRPSAWWSVQLTTAPSTVGRLVHLANSAAYGHSGRVEDLPSAIDALGHRTARHLLFSDLIERMFPVRGREWLSSAPRWRHALAVAAASAVFARRLKLEPGELFVCGLIHDLGQLILARQGGEPYARLEHNFGADPDPATLARQEQEHLGFDHATLGALIAARWGLPPAIVSTVRDHHRLESLREDIKPGTHLKRVAALELAERYVEALGYGPLGAEAMADTAEGWSRALDGLAGCTANEVLGFSRWRLNRLRRAIEGQIHSVIQVARGGEGELWEKPGLLERAGRQVARARLWLAVRPERRLPVGVGAVRRPVPEKLAEGLEAIGTYTA